MTFAWNSDTFFDKPVAFNKYQGSGDKVLERTFKISVLFLTKIFVKTKHKQIYESTFYTTTEKVIHS